MQKEPLAEEELHQLLSLAPGQPVLAPSWKGFKKAMAHAILAAKEASA